VSEEFVPAVSDVATQTDAVVIPADEGGPRVRRGMSDATRALMAKVVEAHKGKDLETDELVPALTETESKPAETKPAETPAAAAPAAAAPVAAQAVADHRIAQLELREKALVEREAALEGRAKGMPDREKFLEKPGATLKAWLRDVVGAESDADAQDALADLITELSGEAGVPIDQSIRLQVEQRKATRSVKALKADLARRESEAAERAKAAERDRQEQNAVATLRQVLSTPDHQAKWPTLSAEDSPHDLVWSVIKAKYAKDGVAPTWDQAAQEAEDYLAAQAEAYVAKRSHIVAKINPAPAAKAVPQNAPQKPRAETTTATATPAPSSEEPMSREERRRKSLAALVGKFAQ
jgi:hypothetical protein